MIICKILWISVFVFILDLSSCNGNRCDISVNNRQNCGDVKIMKATDCLKYEFCCYDPYTEPYCYIKKVAPLLLYIKVFVIDDNLRNRLKQQVNHAFSVLQDNIGLDPVSSHVKLNALLAAFISQSTLSSQAYYPKCPLNVPLCRRTKCGQLGSNNDPNICYQDPRCCYDPDIAIYRTIFGPGFMDNVPACYHGPTASYYMKLAGELLPWNAFYQQTVVDLFAATAQNHNYKAVCSLSLALAETVLKSPVCGWEGISELECKLRDCCFNDQNKVCRYPNKQVFNGALDDLEIYPELKAENDEDHISCSAFKNTYSNSESSLYRRTPCVLQSELLKETGSWCPKPMCCHDINYKTAMLNSLNEEKLTNDEIVDLKTSENENFSLLITNEVETALQTTHCPFFYLKNEALPDLTEKLTGCCQRHHCYLLKQIPVEEIVDEEKIDGKFTPLSYTTDYQYSLQNLSDAENEILFDVSSEIDFNNYEYKPEEITNSTWGMWGSWSKCSKTCGTGIKTKRRDCVNQFTKLQVNDIFCGIGGSFEATTCALNTCVPAKWSSWFSWSNCESGCGIGLQHRVRKCQNEKKFEVGPDKCKDGQDKESRPCAGLACATWSQWSEYGPCNATCQKPGLETRKRSCLIDDIPTQVCFGPTVSSRPCQVHECSVEPNCPGQACTHWTNWVDVLSCSKTCEGGLQMKWRCKAVEGSDTCVENSIKYQEFSCNSHINCN